MMLKSKLFKSSLIIAGLLAVGPAVISERAKAQDLQPAQAPQAEQPQPPEVEAIEEPMEVSEEQIDQFASAYQALQTIQESSQAEMVEVIEAEGLTVEEFEAIAQGQQDPAATQAEVSPEQVEQFSTVYEQVDTIRTNARAEMQSAIQAQGLSVEEFEQILAMAQQDPALQEEINQRLAAPTAAPTAEPEADPMSEEPSGESMSESEVPTAEPEATPTSEPEGESMSESEAPTGAEALQPEEM